jgi:hypothetical protein
MAIHDSIVSLFIKLSLSVCPKLFKLTTIHNPRRLALLTATLPINLADTALAPIFVTMADERCC